MWWTVMIHPTPCTVFGTPIGGSRERILAPTPTHGEPTRRLWRRNLRLRGYRPRRRGLAKRQWQFSRRYWLDWHEPREPDQHRNSTEPRQGRYERGFQRSAGPHTDK